MTKVGEKMKQQKYCKMSENWYNRTADDNACIHTFESANLHNGNDEP